MSGIQKLSIAVVAAEKITERNATTLKLIAKKWARAQKVINDSTGAFNCRFDDCASPYVTVCVEILTILSVFI